MFLKTAVNKVSQLSEINFLSFNFDSMVAAILKSAGKLYLSVNSFSNEEELLTLWLADKIESTIVEEPKIAYEAMKIANRKLKK